MEGNTSTESKEKLIEQSLKYLEKDIHKNCDLITFIKLYTKEINFIYVEDDGVCIYLTSKDIYAISTNSKEISQKISNKIEKCNNCCCKSKWDFEVFNEKYKFKGVDQCYQYLFNKDKSYISNKNIIKLTEEHIPFIVNNYSQKISSDELKSLMKIFSFYGYMNNDNQIVGFVGRHVDGEIGFLEVLKDHRLKGYGNQLMQEIINEKSDLIPFTQVIISNADSIAFHKKIGAMKYSDIVYWCYKDNF